MNLDNFKNSEGKIWLNVASSTYTLDKFINLDNHVFLRIARFGPSAVALMPRKYRALLEQYVHARQRAALLKHDCRKRLPFPDESVDHILCSHFLEHVHAREAQDILSDFRRVLKPGGSLHVVVPDLHQLAADYLRESQAGNPAAADTFLRESLLARETRGTWKYRLLELHGGFGLQHRHMYDRHSMRQRVSEAGFTLVDDTQTPSSEFRKDDGSVHVVAHKPRAS